MSHRAARPPGATPPALADGIFTADARGPPHFVFVLLFLLFVLFVLAADCPTNALRRSAQDRQAITAAGRVAPLHLPHSPDSFAKHHMAPSVFLEPGGAQRQPFRAVALPSGAVRSVQCIECRCQSHDQRRLGDTSRDAPSRHVSVVRLCVNTAPLVLPPRQYACCMMRPPVPPTHTHTHTRKRCPCRAWGITTASQTAPEAT